MVSLSSIPLQRQWGNRKLRMVSRQATIETLHDLEQEEVSGRENVELKNKEEEVEEKGNFLEEARHQPPAEGNVDWGPQAKADSHLFSPKEGR